MKLDPCWLIRPATTVVNSNLIAGPGTSVFVKGGVPRQGRPGATVVTVEQMGLLQGYPEGFKWSRTNNRVQAGNAVPPPIAKRILEDFYE